MYAEAGGDPSLAAAAAPARRGFPFLKRSLLGRYAHCQDEAALRAFLVAQGAPALTRAAGPGSRSGTRRGAERVREGEQAAS